MNDRIQEWLTAKYVLEHDPEAFDSAYVSEEKDNLLATAEDIFKEIVNGQ